MPGMTGMVIVIGPGAYYIDLANKRLILITPEMPILSQVKVLSKAVDLMQATEGMKGQERIRAEATNTIMNAAQAILTSPVVK